VAIFTRKCSDPNVVEVNPTRLPLRASSANRESCASGRHGMGFLGLGSTITHAAHEVRLARRRGLHRAGLEGARALAGWEAALELALEKGPAPIMLEEFEVTAEMLRKRPEMRRDGIKAGQKLPGASCTRATGRYSAAGRGRGPELVDRLAEVGARFTHHSSIARPRGTISLSARRTTPRTA